MPAITTYSTKYIWRIAIWSAVTVGAWVLFSESAYAANYADYEEAHNSFQTFLGTVNEPEERWRSALQEAARCIIKSFRMAYDLEDPDYQSDKIEWAEVAESYALNGFNYALMAADFELARELARWFRDPGDGDAMDIEVNDYAHTLTHLLLGQRKEALAISEARMQAFARKPPKGHNYKTNYYTMMTALYGILIRDNVLFNKGLQQQVDFYAREAKGEYRDTNYEFICDDAVALANLGLHEGMKVTVQDMRMPSGMLLARPS